MRTARAGKTRAVRVLLPFALAVAVAATAACGVPSDPREQAGEVASVAAEGALLAHDAESGASTSAFVRTHADALRERLENLEPEIVEPALRPIARKTAAALVLLASDASSAGVAATLERAAARADELSQ